MKPIRPRVFLDSSVILAGVGSETGASGTLLDLCEAELVVSVLSKQVVVEVDRAVSAKLPHIAEKLRHFLRHLRPIMVEDPPVEKVRQAVKRVHHKDAPILAAAAEAKVDYLITLDKKHFLRARQKQKFDPPVLTPGEFLRIFEMWCHERRRG